MVDPDDGVEVPGADAPDGVHDAQPAGADAVTQDAVPDLDIPEAAVPQLDEPAPPIPDPVISEAVLAEPVIPPPVIPPAPEGMAPALPQPALPTVAGGSGAAVTDQGDRTGDRHPTRAARRVGTEPLRERPAIPSPAPTEPAGDYRGWTFGVYAVLLVLLVGAVVLIFALLAGDVSPFPAAASAASAVGWAPPAVVGWAPLPGD